MMSRRSRRMMDQSRIFGTPPEPVFNMKGCCLSPNLLEELLFTQAASNERQTQKATAEQGIFKCGSLVECVFIICEKTKQPPETRYIAAELFDRFMRAHIPNLKEKVRESHMAPKQRNISLQNEWKHTLRKLCKHLLPFMVSCVQIASKLCSHYNIVTCRRCAELLQDKGHRYQPCKVLTFELLVMKTLNYNLHVASPLSYVETLLEIMGHNDPDTPVKVLHETCLKVLDVVYIKRKLVYERLLQLAVGDSPVNPQTRSKFAPVENDVMLLATATIGAAAYFTDTNSLQMICDHLARITRIPIDDITDFSSTIISVILH
ncbi:cyclin N-terminal domain-containing protein 1 [Strongylocentrotus purpuratus]|uniref:Cyclin N-terminal domain-containing protein n=1 Tax=Strongylocentrotus purpuratus TaxID=7668 RepID=A0A7M7HMJ3_STRPU|nr:cyclin N-terminal domain-containing protein 1 [Strongylocentrotus purpuratus]|eukprot:XP_011674143.1 PREDICTED: cyclin N-terminal domain-containing protein 1 [Strongylocentrotus purpuratus]